MHFPRTIRFFFATAGWAIGMALVRGVSGEPSPDGLPQVHDRARYESLRAHCLFTLATTEATPSAPQPSFAANWFVTGIGRVGDANFVSIKSRDQATQFSLFEGELRKPDDVALVSVNWSDIVGKSTVVVRKGAETARLGFNEAELHAAPALNANPAPNAGVAPNLNPVAGAQIQGPIPTPMPRRVKPVPRVTGPGHPPPAIQDTNLEELRKADAGSAVSR